MHRDHEKGGFVLAEQDISLLGDPPLDLFIPDGMAPYLLKRIDEALARAVEIGTDSTPVGADRWSNIAAAKRATDQLDQMVALIGSTLHIEIVNELEGPKE